VSAVHEPLRVAGGGGGKGFTTTEQDALALLLPDVTLTMAIFEPAKAYAFETVCEFPKRPSSPLHEYVKLPVPPDALAEKETAEPTEALEALAEHETATAVAVEAELAAAAAAAELEDDEPEDAAALAAAAAAAEELPLPDELEADAAAAAAAEADPDPSE
jgi:hypothetical protein